jgi:diguanylate cyclase (GGDEF)-like protein/PAS domain S-box-containing protein
MSENVAVLLVDDRPENLLALEAVLEGMGLDLVKAKSGNDALRFSLKHDFALVLMDVQMPGMSGFEAAELMRSHPKTSHLPIIFVTAGMNDAQLQFKGYELGAVDYLIKPFEPKFLQSKVKVFCDLYTQRRKLEFFHQEQLINSMREGYAHCKMIYKGKQPTDFVYLKVNTAFEQITGLKNVEGRKVSEVIPDIRKSNPELFAIYGRVAATGNPEVFETYLEPLDIWFFVSVYSAEKDHFIAVFQNITGRKQTEVMLKKYKLMIDSANDGYWMTDMKGNLLDANEAYARMSGYTVAELSKMHISQLDAFDQPEDVAARAVRVIAQGHERFETRHRHKDGHLIDIEVSATFMPEAQQFFVFCRDISERKRIDEVLKLNKVIIETAGEGFWRIDLTGHLLEVNQTYADMIGYTREELIGMHISKVSLKSNKPEMVMAMIQKIIELGHISFETQHQRKDGGVVDFETSITYMEKEKSLFAFLHDVTKRKKDEEALRVAAVAFETHDAIVITDARANIVRVNQAFSDITGYSQEEVLGQNPRIMSSGRQDKTFYAEMWQQLLHTGSWAGDILDKRKNGQIYPKWLTITAVKNERQEATHYVAIFSDITARKRAEEEIRNLAFYDALTKLPNRRLFMDRFRAALTISTRRNDYGAVLFIDLDRFKTLNDTLGHDYGDLLLIEVAARTKSCVREMDTVARLGGDEFVVLIEGVSEDQDETSRKVGFIAEKIRETLAQPYMLKSHEHNSSPSIGVCLYHGSEKPVDDLLQQADMAMYQAKNAGRNAVRFFDPLMQQNVASRAALENDLYHAVALGQLQLHYQVQVDDEHRPVGAEALLRWNHPERGLVVPGQFISIAEESTLILDIGSWVLKQACRQLALWAKDEHMCDLSLAVNVSAKQFAQPNFVDIVAGLVKSHQIDSSRLKLELTESMLLHDLKNTIDTMHALKKLGVKLSMDDFGTGYSSLSYLRELPLA